MIFVVLASSTRWVRSTKKHPALSTLLSINLYNIKKFLWKNLGNAENQTWGRWVRGENAVPTPCFTKCLVETKTEKSCKKSVCTLDNFRPFFRRPKTFIIKKCFVRPSFPRKTWRNTNMAIIKDIEVVAQVVEHWTAHPEGMPVIFKLFSYSMNFSSILREKGFKLGLLSVQNNIKRLFYLAKANHYFGPGETPLLKFLFGNLSS